MTWKWTDDRETRSKQATIKKRKKKVKKRKERNLFGYCSGRWLTGDIGDT